MDPNKKSGCTNIIDDLDAIALALLCQRRTPKKSQNVATGRSHPAKAGSSKARPSKKSGARKNDGDPAESSRSKPASKVIKQATRAQYYEKDGVKIPLYEKGGKRRPHARLASNLRNKGTDVLLDIVEEYAGIEKRKVFKTADLTKAQIAGWLEEVETRALGRHPKSNLDFVEDASTVEREDVKPEVEVAPEVVTYKGKGKAPMHTPAHYEGKRKRDNVSEPARGDQQTTKSLKTHHGNGQLAKQTFTEDTPIITAASTKDQRRKVKVKVEKPKPKKRTKLPTLKKDMEEETLDQPTEESKEQEEMARLGTFMVQTGIDISNPDASSKLVVLHEKDEVRVLTASTVPRNGRPILHDTAVPLNVPEAQARLRRLQSARPIEPPFLKAGQHGRHGDFDNDPNRRTGRGHQITPDAQIGLDTYLQFRGQVLQQYPRFPAVNEGQEVHVEVKKSWDANEQWYNDFAHRYPGFSVSHLWPCGCEKLRGESEDGESEAD